MELKNYCVDLEMKLSTKEKEVEKSRSELKSITLANHKLIVESEVSNSYWALVKFSGTIQTLEDIW